MSDQTTPTPLDQPDGIDEQSTGLPEPARAAARVRAYISETGDGLYDIQGGMPLYARDLEALCRAVLNGRTEATR